MQSSLIYGVPFRFPLRVFEKKLFYDRDPPENKASNGIDEFKGCTHYFSSSSMQQVTRRVEDEHPEHPRNREIPRPPEGGSDINRYPLNLSFLLLWTFRMNVSYSPSNFGASR